MWLSKLHQPHIALHAHILILQPIHYNETSKKDAIAVREEDQNDSDDEESVEKNAKEVKYLLNIPVFCSVCSKETANFTYCEQNPFR